MVNNTRYSAMTADYGPEVYHEQPGLEPAPYKSKEYPIAQVTSTPTTKRRNFRLGTAALVVVAALASGVIVGAAVGGGLGAELANCHRHAATQSSITTPVFISSDISSRTSTSATSSATTSSTSSADAIVQAYTPVVARSVNTTAFNCPAIDGTSYTTANNIRYVIYCGVDMWGGLTSYENSKLPISDLVNTIAYTVDDCIEACGAFNGNSKAWGRTTFCRGISFRRNLRNQTITYGGNCWLKNATLPDGQVGGAGASWSGIAAADVLSAKLDPSTL